jgi:uncharacterized protein (DUF488 family)
VPVDPGFREIRDPAVGLGENVASRKGTMIPAIPAPPTIWTIGHSTRAGDEFADCLVAHGIELLVDVRRFPGSRRLPQFSAEALEASLVKLGISYRWMESLGGRRRCSAATVESAWRNASFAAYAEHLRSEEFAEGLFELLLLAGGLHTAIMCSEVLWWRCHRRLIADVLVSLGIPVTHIYSAHKTEPHRLVTPARLVDGALSYA